MNLAIVGRVSSKDFGSAETLKFTCADCELIENDEDLRIFPSFCRPHVSVFGPEASLKWRNDWRSERRRDNFFSAINLPEGSGFEIYKSTTVLFINVYVGVKDFYIISLELEKALASDVLHLWLSFELPWGGHLDSSQESCSIDQFRAGEHLYFLGLPGMQLVQRHIP